MARALGLRGTPLRLRKRGDSKRTETLLIGGYLAYEAVYHLVGLTIGPAKYPDSSGSRHCYASCVVTRLCLQPELILGAGLLFELGTGLNGDWTEDLGANWQGVKAAAQF
jgi:hypothetical protein